MGNIVPVFNKIPDSPQLNKDNWFQFHWKNKNSHRYLATLDDEKFNSLKNIYNAKAFWNEILQDEKLATSYAGWGSRNPNFFDTGINIQNGDIFSITWRGDHAYYSLIKFNTKENDTIELHLPGRQVLTTKCLWNDLVTDSSKGICRAMWYSNSHLKMKDPSDSNGFYIENSTPSRSLDLFGEEFRKGGIEKFALNVNANDQSKMKEDIGKNQQYGLVGQVTDVNLVKWYIDGKVQYDDDKTLSCTCPSSADQGDGCRNRYEDHHCINKGTFRAGQGQYSLNGTFSAGENFNNRSRLALMHYDGYTSNVVMYRGWYTDNMGGYELEIDLEWLS